MFKRPHSNASRRGQSLLLMAVAIPVLVGFLGLALDVGYLQLSKQRLQAASDGAAMAVAADLNRSLTQAGLLDSAKSAAAANGFTDGQNGVSVIMNSPPLNGRYSGRSGYYETIITQNLPTFFMRMFNVNNVNIAGRSVSHLGGVASGGCTFVMDPDDEGAMRVDGTFTTECGVRVNSSNASKALWRAGGTMTAPFFKVFGGYTGPANPAVTTGVARAADPLATLAAPPFPTTHYYGVTVTTSGTTLNPGIYHGGIWINEQKNVTFNPGVYVLNGGNLFSAGKNVLTGNGVTFYFTAGLNVPSPPSGFNAASTNSMGTVLINGGTSTLGTTNLIAPRSGAGEGILFMQDRTKTPSGPFDIQGQNQTNLEGIIYIPNNDLLYQNETYNNGKYNILVCKTLRLDGGGPVLHLGSDFTVLSSGNPLKSGPVLAE